MAYSTYLLNGKVLPRAVLLDNQSTTHVFCNRGLVHNIKKVPQGFEEDLATNGGM